MKTVIINRSKWRTGSEGINATGIGETRLLNDDGYKCCLGFMCGAYKKKIKNLVSPEDCQAKIPFLTQKDEYGDYIDSELATKAIRINDDIETTPQEKEKLLKQLFKGKINLKFVGKYEKV